MNIANIRRENLRKIIKENFKTRAAFADKIGKSPSQVAMWFMSNQGKRDIGEKLAREIESALNLATYSLDIAYAHEKEGLNDIFKISIPKSAQNVEVIKNESKVPLIDMVAAGNWCEVADPYPVGDAESWESCPVPHGEHTFALRINGESMAPKFQHGEIIFCDPCKKAENGDFVIAKLTDENQATFKQLIIEGGQSMLKALNPAWPTPYTPINGNCHIVGKVIARLEKF